MGMLTLLQYNLYLILLIIPQQLIREIAICVVSEILFSLKYFQTFSQKYILFLLITVYGIDTNIEPC